MIVAKNIVKVYKTKDKKTTALDDVSLAFGKTGFVSILGPSGCGKTTLLNILGGLDTYTEGELFINNQNTKDFGVKEWDNYRLNNIGFIFQNYNLIPTLTVEENLALVLHSQGDKVFDAKSKIKEILEKFNLYSERKKFPKQLSGGQQQRIAIARALIKKPQVILADEPTGALDSKTAEEVVSLLKEASKTCLVVVVTHNEKLANLYSDRIINLFDGKIIVDEEKQLVNDNPNKINIKRKKLIIAPLVILNFRNFMQKIIRSLLIILANSVGVIGVCLVLTISHGVKKYIIDIQKETLSNSPITIRSTVDYTNPNDEPENLPLYPSDDVIHIVSRFESYYSHINIFSLDFLDYLSNLDSSLYNIIDYKTNLDMKILTLMHGQIKKVPMYKFLMIGQEQDYLSRQYECLYGSFPQDMNDLVILVDKYNSIDVSVLNYLGIDYEGLDSYTFSEITKKEYKVIENNQYYYQKLDGNFGYYPSSQYLSLYEEATLTLKITGILRLKKDAKANIYESGILYTKELRDYLIDDANNSLIGLKQKEYGLNKNVFTGQPFVDSVSLRGTVTKEYQYEGQLGDLGLIDELSTIRIYTDNFEARVAINEYLKQYNLAQEKDKRILYYDYMGDFSREFDAFVEVLTKTLLIFAVISLFVSSIMIGIITYISVMEKVKEIGILRSLGYRRSFIRILFNTQNALIGCFSGIIGIISASFLMKPIVGMIVKIMEDNKLTTFNISSLTFASFGFEYLFLLIVMNLLLAIIAGSIPAYFASRLKPVDAINKE